MTEYRHYFCKYCYDFIRIEEHPSADPLCSEAHIEFEPCQACKDYLYLEEFL